MPDAILTSRRWLLFGAVLTLLLCLGLAAAGFGEAVVLGAVQGLAEFLPISSSAHLILVPWLFGWQGGVVDTLTFDVALHLGTLIAVLGYFWRDWYALILAIPGWLQNIVRQKKGAHGTSDSIQQRMLTLIVIATIPGAIAGVLLDSWAEHSLRAPLLLAITLPLLGVFLFIADTRAAEEHNLDSMTRRQALWIGLAQAFAIIPGVSRSGITMTMGRALKLDRSTAAHFSFLLSAPITAAAVLFKLNAILHIPPGDIATFVIGVAVSAAVGALTIGGLLAYLRRAGFAAFTVYRIVVALCIVLISLAR